MTTAADDTAVTGAEGIAAPDPRVPNLRRLSVVTLVVVGLPIVLASVFWIGGGAGIAIGAVVGTIVSKAVLVVVVRLLVSRQTNQGDPTVTRAIQTIVERHWEDGDANAAIMDLQALQSLHGEHFNLLLACGGVLLEDERPAEALVLLDRAIERGARDHAFMANRAVLLKVEAWRELGRLDDAESLLDELITRDPALRRFTELARARLHADRGRFQESHEGIARAERALPRWPGALLVRSALVRKLRTELADARTYVAEREAAHALDRENRASP